MFIELDYIRHTRGSANLFCINPEFTTVLEMYRIMVTETLIIKQSFYKCDIPYMYLIRPRPIPILSPPPSPKMIWYCCKELSICHRLHYSA